MRFDLCANHARRVLAMTAEASQAGAEKVVWVPRVADAVDRAIELAGSDGIVLVTGSLYVVGEARSHLSRR